jgi:hypothetical protein
MSVWRLLFCIFEARRTVALYCRFVIVVDAAAVATKGLAGAWMAEIRCHSTGVGTNFFTGSTYLLFVVCAAPRSSTPSVPSPPSRSYLDLPSGKLNEPLSM